jgi:hypothetical protein
MQSIMHPTEQSNKTLFLNTNKWYKVLLVWELYRIPYNLLMIAFCLVGITIASINVPLLYLLAGGAFNVCYTFLSIIDLYIKVKSKIDLSKKIFGVYLGISAFMVIALPAALLV